MAIFLNFTPMTDLFTLLPKVPAQKVRELELIRERLIEKSAAQMIILFGSYARGDFKTDFHPKQPKKSDFDLLVVVDDKDQINEVLSLHYSNEFDKDISTTTQLVVETIEVVNKNLRKNQFFYSDIRREGKVLYDSRKYTLSEGDEFSATERREIAEEDYKGMIKQAHGFYRRVTTQNSLNSVDIVDMKLIAFDLQQLAEFCYKTVILVFTHYNPHEHYLSILRNFAIEYDTRISEAFPLTTPQLKDDFQHLDFAYIGGRYIDEQGYSVTKEQLVYWTAEAEKLIKLTEMVCEEKIERLRAVE